MMANMVAAPQGDVIANSHKGLDGIVFKDKTVISNLAFVQHGGMTADVVGKGVPECFCGKILFFSHGIEFGIAQGDKHVVAIGSVVIGDIFKCDDGQPTKGGVFDITTVYSEGHNFINGVCTEVEVSQLRDIARSEYN
jgi:hypothetical protein